MKVSVDLLVVHADQLITLQGPNETPRTGQALEEIGLIRGGALAGADGVIVSVGTTEQVLDEITLSPRRPADQRPGPGGAAGIR